MAVVSRLDRFLHFQLTACSWCALLRISSTCNVWPGGTVRYGTVWCLRTYVHKYTVGVATLRVHFCVRTVCMYGCLYNSASSTDENAYLMRRFAHTRSYEYGNLFLTATVGAYACNHTCRYYRLRKRDWKLLT